MHIPLGLVAIACRVGDILQAGPLRTTSLKQIQYGNTGDAAGFIAAIGFTPRYMNEALATHPAQTQDRWHARLFLLRPLISFVLLLLWWISGALGFSPQGQAAALLLGRFGIAPQFLPTIQILSSSLDILIGFLVLLGPRKAIGIVQLSVILAYTTALTVIAPALWLDPFGPLLKNLPIALLVLVWMALAEKR